MSSLSGQSIGFKNGNSNNGRNNSKNNSKFCMFYPLSQSNSYIVFSDGSLQGTMDRQNMKREESAVMIQKHWKGYWTRKLLTKCIDTIMVDSSPHS